MENLNSSVYMYLVHVMLNNYRSTVSQERANNIEHTQHKRKIMRRIQLQGPINSK